MMRGHERVGAWAAALTRQTWITVERRRIVVAAIDPYRLRRIGDVKNDHAFVAVSNVKAVIVLLDLVACDHLIAAVGICTIALRKALAHMLADDVEARH